MKAHIRQDRVTREWQVTRPRLGFGHPETHTFRSWSQAMRWADQRITRSAGMASQAASQVERAEGDWSPAVWVGLR